MSNFMNSIPILKTPKSKFNLSYTHKTTCDMGQLIPIGNWICYPGEKYTLGNSAVIRLQPLVAPLMHRIKVKVASFFVPWRICWEGYEEWQNLGRDGDGLLTTSLPLWDNYYNDGSAPAKYSLWDYLGRNTLKANDSTKDPDKNFIPNDLLRRAYNLIYNEYFINRNVQNNDVALDNNNILHVNFKNDYFASALPFQQRGTDPAIALSFNDTPIVWDLMDTTQYNGANGPMGTTGLYTNASTSAIQTYIKKDLSDSVSIDNVGGADGKAGAIGLYNSAASGAPKQLSYKFAGKRIAFTNQNQMSGSDRAKLANFTDEDLAFNNLSDKERDFIAASWQTLGLKTDNSELASTFDANELRMLLQTKKFLERNARCGSRYTEQLIGRWGVFAGDARLQRPEFIYSTTNSIGIEELPQLSEDGNTPQGHLAGKGLGAQTNAKAGRYVCKEHGCIIQLMWLVPDLDYIPQGFDRETLIHTKLDEYSPEFAHLSEQMIKKGELYFRGLPETDNAMFGYEPIWSEMRHRRNIATADMRDTFDYWHLGRKFANQPSLNEDFIKVDGTTEEFKRIFASGTTGPGFLVAFHNECLALRPLPKYGTPGFVDHF